jgi:hypothetical protein
MMETLVDITAYGSQGHIHQGYQSSDLCLQQLRGPEHAFSMC